VPSYLSGYEFSRLKIIIIFFFLLISISHINAQSYWRGFWWWQRFTYRRLMAGGLVVLSSGKNHIQIPAGTLVEVTLKVPLVIKQKIRNIAEKILSL